tara:strand:+ start:6478 stop:7005 length:528 start_codon:yes stop_codon:yes gene_type:complete
MHINPVDERVDLFQITDVLDISTIENLSREALESLPYTTQEWQTDWKRKRLVILPGSVLESIHNEYNTKRDLIGEAVGLDITSIDTRFWLDFEGFDCGKHVDNDGVNYVMQVFLSEAPANLGTVFYNNDSLRKAFNFTKNSGYIMFNNGQQMHGMEQKVPKDVLRLTSYSYFQTR